MKRFEGLMPLFMCDVDCWWCSSWGDSALLVGSALGRLGAVPLCAMQLLEPGAQTSPPLSFNDFRLMDQNIPLPVCAAAGARPVSCYKAVGSVHRVSDRCHIFNHVSGLLCAICSLCRAGRTVSLLRLSCGSLIS